MNHQTVRKLSFSKKLLLAGTGLLAVAGPAIVGVIDAPSARAQNRPEAQPQFDVASVKINTTGTAASRFLHAQGTVDGRNVVLKLLLNYAYGVEGFNISGGPGWVNSERFDIQAKAAPNTPDSQMRIMMQALLADRFGLQVHRETKDSRVFVLTAAKGGTKLRPLKEGSCVSPDPNVPPGPPVAGQKPICGIPQSSVNGPNLVIDAVGMDTTTWVRTLSSMLNRAVVNETGLSGLLDVLHFEYSRDDLSVAASDTGAISISTALNEQLGLKLETATRPLEVLVIDRVEQPSAN
jgi:uncharacterized protein (TIGR03435 family)